ncbi:MAG: glycoside hydrolase family 13 protein [Eubacteriales bacterium]|nr:glycoside hydrolase family 13 protein [Eubacteriales bacterium]
MTDVKLSHYINDKRYRSPMGAIPAGTALTLRLDVNKSLDDIESVRLYYAYGLMSFFSGYLPMDCDEEGEARSSFAQTIRMDDVAGLFFYWFEVRLKDKRYRWCFPDPERSKLEGHTLLDSLHFSLCGKEEIPGFQVTVYTPRFETPDWMKGAVVYQIFPDRFNRGENFDKKAIEKHLHYEERIWHDDWQADVDIDGKPGFPYEANDFFGGTLQGIKEKLPYIASFGVDCIYLNPIFQSRTNHRYDTGDYFKIDPLLGTEEDFKELCTEAAKYGISLILDGVFSHTGADSRYFNKYGRYDSVGAWQEMTEGRSSPYSAWYKFAGDSDAEIPAAKTEVEDEPVYESWWGFDNLPNVREEELSYKDFITGPDGVLAYWLKAGARGYRLDVSDEIPDPFLRSLRRRVKSVKEDAYIVGEVWDGPTSQISYGAHRDFIFGRTHDATTNYPAREAVFSWLLGYDDTENICDRFNYYLLIMPREALYVMLNPLGSHDTERVVNVLSGVSTPASRKEQRKRKLSDRERNRGEARLILALLLQVAFPGAAHLYYGDERAMEGFKDPFNRRTYPWHKEEPELTGLFRSILNLRHEHAVLRTGEVEMSAVAPDVIQVRRYFNAPSAESEAWTDTFGNPAGGEKEMIFLFNRSNEKSEALKALGDKSLPAMTGALVTGDTVRYFTRFQE